MFEIIWYGNATMKLKYKNSALITDPFITRNKTLRPLSFEDIRDADAMLIGHGHFDHVVDVPAFSKQSNMPIYAAPNVIDTLAVNNTNPENLKAITPGESVTIGDFEVIAYAAKHVKFDLPLIFQTLGNILFKPFQDKFKLLSNNLKDHRKFKMGDCLGFYIKADNKTMFHLSSMALDENENYPQNMDVLSLPFQGHSRLDLKGAEMVKVFKPKAVYLHHIDNAFPPISQATNCKPFIKLMKSEYPDIPVIIPDYLESVEVGRN